MAHQEVDLQKELVAAAQILGNLATGRIHLDQTNLSNQNSVADGPPTLPTLERRQMSTPEKAGDLVEMSKGAKKKTKFRATKKRGFARTPTFRNSAVCSKRSKNTRPRAILEDNENESDLEVEGAGAQVPEDEQIDTVHRCSAFGCLDTFDTMAEVDFHYNDCHDGSQQQARQIASHSSLVQALALHLHAEKIRAGGSRPKSVIIPQLAPHTIKGLESRGQTADHLVSRTPQMSPPEISMFPCEVCGKVFGTTSDLRCHVELRHPPLKRATIPCPMPGCRVLFVDSVNLVQHLLAEHPGGRVLGVQ